MYYTFEVNTKIFSSSLDIVFYLDIKAPQVKSLFFEDIKMEKCIRCQSSEVKKN